MTRIKLKHINSFKDRHGRLRFYFRRPGCKSVALHGLPGSSEFMRDYETALAGDTTPFIEIGAGRVKPGTVAALTLAYFNSIGFQNLAKSTQHDRRYILERFVAEHGDKRIGMLQRGNVEKMVAAKAKTTPSHALKFLIVLRALLKFGVDTEALKENAAAGVERPKISSEGHRTWTEEDIAAFEARHPVGTKARLALALLLCTAQRVGDVLRMGRQHIRDGAIVLRQGKTGSSLSIPILPELQTVLDAIPESQLTFLTTRYGKPYTGRGFTTGFAVWREQAGLPKGLVPHGLRKSACVRLALHGCSTKEIAAISGHLTLREIERYTMSAEQERLARSAMARLTKNRP
jgi:integrase